MSGTWSFLDGRDTNLNIIPWWKGGYTEDKFEHKSLLGQAYLSASTELVRLGTRPPAKGVGDLLIRTVPFSPDKAIGSSFWPCPNREKSANWKQLVTKRYLRDWPFSRLTGFMCFAV